MERLESISQETKLKILAQDGEKRIYKRQKANEGMKFSVRFEDVPQTFCGSCSIWVDDSFLDQHKKFHQKGLKRK